MKKYVQWMAVLLAAFTAQAGVFERGEYLTQLQFDGFRQFFCCDHHVSSGPRRCRYTEAHVFLHECRCRTTVLLLQHLCGGKTHALLLQHARDMIASFRHHFVEQILPAFIHREGRCLRAHIQYSAAVHQDMIAVTGRKSREQGLRSHKHAFDASTGLRERFLQLCIHHFASAEGRIVRLNEGRTLLCSRNLILLHTIQFEETRHQAKNRHIGVAQLYLLLALALHLVQQILTDLFFTRLVTTRIDGHYLHGLTANRQKGRRQLIYAYSVCQQLKHLCYHITGIARLRDDTLFHAHVAKFLRPLFYAENLKQIRSNTSRSHRSHTVTPEVNCHERKRVCCFGLFSCHNCSS